MRSVARVLTFAGLALLVRASIAQAPPAPPAEPVVVIHAGTLIAVAGKAPMREASIVVRGRKILEVRAGFRRRAGRESRGPSQ